MTIPSLVACAHGSHFDRIESRAVTAGFSKGTLRAGEFTLTRYLRAQSGERLVVYLEGDADAWPRGRRHVTASPPPVHPLALELAGLDPGRSVAWLGRPCQPVAPDDAEGCEPTLWSGGRFSERVVAALDAGLDVLRAEVGARHLELIGYSGGGVLATLLAARRDDVVQLVTVAAPLDLAAWVAHHDLGDLDAVDPASLGPDRLGGVPQRHFAGARDETVPPEVLDGYLAHQPTARLDIEADRGHGDWADGWPERVRSWR